MNASFTPRDAAGLRERLAGPVVLPGQEEYDAARQVWNASHDHRPALIAQPLSVADVQAAVLFAADRGLPVSVRGGGHNHAGYAVADGALMLDLSAMTSVRVDPARRVATVSGGATWGVVDQATQAADLAVTGADVSPVGVGGATLGGGVGWLHRMHGLSGDNLLAAEIVTAGAEVLRVSAQEHPELFWALRGGGGNFGAVTAFTFALHPVGPVHAGTVICPMERAAGALALYQHLCETGGDGLFLGDAGHRPAGPVHPRAAARPACGDLVRSLVRPSLRGPSPRCANCASSGPRPPTCCGRCPMCSCSACRMRRCPAGSARPAWAGSPARSAPG